MVTYPDLIQIGILIVSIMVTYPDLIQIGILIVSIISLYIQANKK